MKLHEAFRRFWDAKSEPRSSLSLMVDAARRIEERLDILEGDANHEAGIIGEFRKRIEMLEKAPFCRCNNCVKQPGPKSREPRRGQIQTSAFSGVDAVELTPDVERRLKAREERQHQASPHANWYDCPAVDKWCVHMQHRIVYVVEEEK